MRSAVQPGLEAGDAVPADVYRLMVRAGQDHLEFAAGKVDQVADGAGGNDVLPVDPEKGFGIKDFRQGIQGVVDHIIAVLRCMDVGALVQAVKVQDIRHVDAPDMLAHPDHEAGLVGLAEHLADAEQQRGIRVVTNSIPVLERLAGCPGIDLCSCGGIVQHQTRSLIGREAVRTFRQLCADKVFIGASGVDVNFGVSNTNLAEVAVKQSMIACGRTVFLLADYTKIGVVSLVQVAPIECLSCIITSSGVSLRDRRALMERGIDVYVAHL